MKQHLIKIVSFLLAVSAVFSMTACGDAADKPSDTSAPAGDTSAAEEGYDYEGLDFGGYEFKILNHADKWKTYVHLDFDEQTGESLDDAVYSRNRKVEEKLNFKLVEVETQYTATTDTIQLFTQSVMAGDNAYDAAYLPVAYQPAVITDGYLLDLNEIPELQLDEAWWDTAFNDMLEIGGRQLVVSSPLNLMPLDLSWVLLFNQDIFDDLKLEYPYQLVRDGKWTLEAFYNYVSQTSSLNGDESFKFNKDGSCVYSIAAHGGAPMAFSYGSGNTILSKNGSSYDVTIDTERTFETVDWLLKIFSTSSGYVNFNNDSTSPGYYIDVFRSGRAAFLTCEVKATMEERDMNDTFGLLPIPKFDEAQTNYYTQTTYGANLLTIPRTQENTARAGKILDALSYESLQSVLPIYYDITVSQKGLRNDDSIEMLQIVRESRGSEYSLVLGVSMSYYTAHSNMIISESNSMASLAATHKPQIQAKIDALVEAMK